MNHLAMVSEGAIEVTVLVHDRDEEGYGFTQSYLLTTTNDSNKSSADTMTMIPNMRLISTIFVYALPVIIALGTIGNVLSFLVLVRCPMRSTSVYYYLMALAIADTCVLYVSAFKTWIRLLTGFELQHSSAFSCRMVAFMLLFSQHLSAWLIVLVTIDRFMVVWFPFKASSLCTVSRARLATAALVIVFILYNCHVFWTYELMMDHERNWRSCGPVESYHFMRKPFDGLTLTTYSLIPFLIILVLNVAIITRLQWKPLLLRSRTSGGNSSTFSGSDRSESSACGKQAKVTYMLVVVSFAWLILTLPKSIHTIVVELNVSQNYSRIAMFRGVSFLLMYTNHAINFYLYCITGKKFRRQLEELSKGVCARKRLNSSSTVCSPSRKTHIQKTNVVDLELHDIAAT